ncbi:MAG: histidine phosphatase family protein [Acidobacteriota bacterium]|nr:histidine phosphatase family protein [Acidobacteriota bacterium]
MDTRLFLVRHGEPRQHSDRIFLGQTNVPLSDRGRDEAAAAGDELVRLQCRPDRIYSSDLLRARETAEIISARLGGAPIANVAAFRELNMGVWDGKLIEDIRRQFPDEYVKRGDDILNYRVPDGENFYDLRERVAREFHRVFQEEFFPALRAGGSPDFLIVSHLGVIHALIAELTREDMNAVMRRRWPTGSVVQCNYSAYLDRFSPMRGQKSATGQRLHQGDTGRQRF